MSYNNEALTTLEVPATEPPAELLEAERRAAEARNRVPTLAEPHWHYDLGLGPMMSGNSMGVGLSVRTSLQYRARVKAFGLGVGVSWATSGFIVRAALRPRRVTVLRVRPPRALRST